MDVRTRVSRRNALLLAVCALSGCGTIESSTTSAPVNRMQPTRQPVPSASQSSVRATVVPPTAQPTLPPATPATPVQLAPELAGGQSWINSEPLTLAGLRGNVVLIDFWTYGCYNCKNTLPSVQSWWHTYKDQGLVIVGVHTPEFSSEAVLDNVQRATRDLGVSWPVVQDNDHAIWDAYHNNYWPRFYLVNKRGAIVYDHIGEGAYEETERQIQAALAEKA